MSRLCSSGVVVVTPTFCMGTGGVLSPASPSVWPLLPNTPEPIHTAAAITTPTATMRLGLNSPEAIRVTRQKIKKGSPLAASQHRGFI